MINKGDKVIIIGSAEEEKYKDCVFEVLSEPYNVCGSTVVKMKCREETRTSTKNNFALSYRFVLRANGEETF